MTQLYNPVKIITTAGGFTDPIIPHGKFTVAGKALGGFDGTVLLMIKHKGAANWVTDSQTWTSDFTAIGIAQGDIEVKIGCAAFTTGSIELTISEKVT